MKFKSARCWPMSAGMGIRVLVVEEDAANRMLFADLLSLVGFGVSAVAEAAEARQWLSQNPAPALVMLEPGGHGEGLRLLAWIREQPALSGVPVMAVTGFAMKGQREELLSLGFDDYLAKPIDTRHFGAYARGVVALRQFAAFSRSPGASNFSGSSGDRTTAPVMLRAVAR